MFRLCFALALACTATLPIQAHAGHQHTHGHASSTASPATAPQGISVDGCWIRAMPVQVPSGGYFVVRNASEHAMQLTGIATPAFGQTMLHQTVHQDGMARMMHIDAVDIPAKGELAFQPGSYHAMLEQAAVDLTPGNTVAMTFLFGDKGQVQADCELRSPASLGGH